MTDLHNSIPRIDSLKDNNHVNVHAKWKPWSDDQQLHLAVPYSNPFRWRTRRELFNNFRQQISLQPNVHLHVGELAYGDRPWEITGEHQGDVQFRTTSEMFHKENIINETIRTFPPNWRYGGYADGDFTFTRHDWSLETIHLLQHYDFVQLFSTYTDMTGSGYGGLKPTIVGYSFAHNYVAAGHVLHKSINPGGWGMTRNGRHTPMTHYGPPYGQLMGVGGVGIGALGGAWAFRRSAYETVGGLLDTCILGHGDWFMAFGLICEVTMGKVGRSLGSKLYHRNYNNAILAWQHRAALLKKNIGCIDQFALHNFHGSKKNRGYQTRDQILIKHKFDPIMDLRRNFQGIYELTGNKPDLRDAIRDYFIARQEDDTRP